MELSVQQAAVAFLRKKGYEDAADDLEAAFGGGLHPSLVFDERMAMVGMNGGDCPWGLGSTVEVRPSGDNGVVMPNHYGRWDIEPMRFIVENNGPGFLVENATKYLWRYDAKDGHKDLAKAARYLEMLREYEAGRPKWYEAYDGSPLPDDPKTPLRSKSRG